MRTGYVAVFAVLAALLLPSAARAQYFDCESYVYYDGNALSGYSRTVDYNMEYVVGVESTLYDPYHQQMDQNSDFPLYFTWAEADVREYPYQWDAWFSVEGQHWYWGDDWCQYGCWEELPGSYYPTYVESTPPPPPAQITVCPVPSPPWGPGNNSAVIGGSGFSGNTPQVSWSGNGGVNFLQSSSATVTSDTQINFSVSLAPVTSDGSITLGVGTAACVIPVLFLAPPPISLSLSRPSLIQILANGNPSPGTYSWTQDSTQSNAPWLQYPPGVSQNTQPNPKEVVVPSAAGTTPGGLSQFSVWYQDSYGRSTPPNSFKLASFGVTCYIVAVEADWYNSQTQSCGSQTYYGRLYEGWWENPPGLPGRTLCSAFLGETRVNGSGLTRDGTKIKWVSGDTYAVVSQWTTAQGDIVDETKANQIVARDTSIIPLGQPRVYLDLASIGSNILAGDIGGAIGSYRLDLFKGIGHASGCPSGWTSRIAVGTCSPETAGCPKQEVQ